MAGITCAAGLLTFKTGVTGFTFCEVAPGSGAPTVTSHLCPGCPCAGLSLGMAVLVTILSFAGEGAIYAGGVAGAKTTGKEVDLFDSVPGVTDLFSPQDVKVTTQKKKAVYNISFMGGSFCAHQNTQLIR